MKNRPIGVYDSGVGGLTVLSALRRAFPQETFIYFADTLNLPYGDKTQNQIRDYSHGIASWFQNIKQVKLIVAACHTSSALALDDIAQDFEVPIVGTIRPLVERVLKDSIHQRIGIIATVASATSRFHEKILREQGFEGEVISIGCPDFVPLIEATPTDRVALRARAQEYLAPFVDRSLDTLIYGCTHYPFLKDILETLLPHDLSYLDPAEAIAKEVRDHLEANDYLNDDEKTGDLEFYCSQDPETFKRKIRFLTDVDNPLVGLVNLSSDSSLESIT